MGSLAAERRRRRAHGDADVARTVALLGDPARAAMLMALLDGRPFSISDLAAVAGVRVSTASGHIGALRAAEFVEVERRGRTRLVRLVRPDIVDALEAIARVAPGQRTQSLGGNERRAALLAARLCYDHLAGELGVGIFAALVAAKAIEPPIPYGEARKVHGGLGDVALGPNAEKTFGLLDLDVEKARESRRRFAISCLDWSHKRPHLAGALGAELAKRFFDRLWIEQTREPRIVRITPSGRTALRDLFGLVVRTGPM